MTTTPDSPLESVTVEKRVERHVEEFDRTEVEQFGTAMIMFTSINILILGVFSTIYVALILVVMQGSCAARD